MKLRLSIFWIFGLALAGTTTAHAQMADVDWSGFYLGARLGGVHTVGDTSASTVDGFAGSYFTGNDPELIAASSGGTVTAASPTVGVLGGYGRQWGNVYLGLDAGIDLAAANGSRTSTAFYQTAPTITYTTSLSYGVDWQANVLARLGWAQDRWLAYVSGGFVLAGISLDTSFTDTLSAGARGQSSTDETKLGLAVGLGGEYAIDESWSVRADYRFTDYGSMSTSPRITNPSFAALGNDLENSVSMHSHAVSVGLSYRF